MTAAKDSPVLLISKPVVPPWDDSARNITRDLVRFGSKYSYRVLTTKGADAPAANAEAIPIYGSRGSHSPSMGQKIRVMAYGLLPRGTCIYHYFFAPNPLTAFAGKVQRKLARVKTVQSICSKPASFDNVASLLFTDVVIVLSEHTKREIIDAGVQEDRVKLVRPGIEAIDPLSPENKADVRRRYGFGDGPLIIYPGDLEFSSAPQTFKDAIVEMARELPDATFVFACRIKTPAALSVQEQLKSDIDRLGLSSKVVFINAVDAMPEFVGAADVIILPSESLYAKMDAPLVLLEAMSQKVPVVVADVPPLDEIVQTGGALGVPPGDPVKLTDAVLKILKNKDLSDQLGVAGRKAILGPYAASTMAAKTEAIYDELLAR